MSQVLWTVEVKCRQNPKNVIWNGWILKKRKINLNILGRKKKKIKICTTNNKFSVLYKSTHFDAFMHGLIVYSFYGLGLAGEGVDFVLDCFFTAFSLYFFAVIKIKIYSLHLNAFITITVLHTAIQYTKIMTLPINPNCTGLFWASYDWGGGGSFRFGLQCPPPPQCS